MKNFGELIKWPQCVITGVPITVEQAAEILARTDIFFDGTGSNQRKFDEKIWNEIKCPHYDWNDNGVKYTSEDYTHFSKKRKRLDLYYLDNNYISSCFVGGVHGWCHPDGTIHFWDNIGKWPTWNEVYEDCKRLAEEFQFLDMKIYLFNQEGNCEEYYNYPKECVGGFEIKNGRVRALEYNEWLDPHDPLCSAPWNDTDIGTIESHVQYINDAKRKIFGDRADLNIFKDSWGELFFNETEFREYFKKYFYENN